MTIEKIFELPYRLNYDPELADENFAKIRKLAIDKEAVSRSWAARQLVDYDSEEAKEILFSLSRDNDYLVRTEAYDSLSAFPYEDVAQLLKCAMTRERSGLARGYAIMSWAEVLYDMDAVSKEDIHFLKREERLRSHITVF